MKKSKGSVLPSSLRGLKMGTNAKKISICVLAIVFAAIGCITYDNVRKKLIYDNLDISFEEVEAIEYGTANYNPLDLIKSKTDGEIVSYTKEVDTSKVGKQQLVFEVKKDDVVKEFKIDVEVKDTQAPTVALKEEEITITEGDEFDIQSNIESVADVVDGDISFSDKKTDDANYTISSDFDNTKAGDYNVVIKAVDANGNEIEKTYKIKVNAKPVVKAAPAYTPVNYTTDPASIDTSSVVSAASSLIGTKYTAGGTSPETGFDCSGFVKYVYSLFGINLSGGSSSQLSAGAAVSEADLQPGDIIIWANNGSNSAAHSSIYAGDNSIIHATSNKGVQKTNLNSWKAWGQHIIGIRRV